VSRAPGTRALRVPVSISPLARRRALETTLVIAAYTLVAIAITWPLAADFSSRITGGGFASDQAGYVWDFWYIAAHGLDIWGPATQEVVGAPFGRPVAGALNATQLVTLGPGWIVAKLFSPVVAYNVTALSSLALSSAAMYALVRVVGLGRAPAAWGGLMFMLIPYHLARVTAHVPLSHLECFPLLLIAAIRWLERPTRRRAGWLAAAVALAWLTNPYYGLMCSVMVVVIIAVQAVRRLALDGPRSAVVATAEAAVALAILVGAPLGALFLAGRGALADNFTRVPIELELYGARLTDYVVPNIGNTFMRGVLGADWAAHGSPGGERTVFLGWTVLLFAVIGVFLIARNKNVGERLRIALWLSIPTAVVLILFSLASPTRWFGAELTMPAQYLFDAAPYLRSFARFGVPVAAIAILVAAAGLALAIKGRSITTSLSVLSIAFILGVVEVPDNLIVPTGPPLQVEGRSSEDLPTWRWLTANDPKGIVMEVPAHANELVDRVYMYGQLLHGRTLLNGGLNGNDPGTDIAAMNADPVYGGSAARLAAAGVTVITVNPWSYRAQGLAPPDASKPPPGYAVKEIYPDGSAVWGVTAKADDAIAIPRRTTWWAPQFIDGRVWRYLGETARLTALAPAAGVYRATFEAHGFLADERYPVAINIDGTTTTVVVAGARKSYSVEFRLPAGQVDINLVNQGPKARMISAIDQRVVSVEMSDWTLSRVR
jgi:hypothetical protein